MLREETQCERAPGRRGSSRRGAGVAALLAMVLAVSSVVGLPAPAHAAGVGIWSSATVPVVASQPDPAAVTLGTRFVSGVGGSVAGVRFYRSAENVGPHPIFLWSGSGELLAKEP